MTMPEGYDADFVLVFDEDIRVRMQDATYQDLVLWQQKIGEEANRAHQAQQERDRYVDSRLEMWRGRDDIKTLGDLEGTFFGHSSAAGKEHGRKYPTGR